MGVGKAYSAPEISSEWRPRKGDLSESRTRMIVNISLSLVSEIYAQNILN